MRRYVFGYVNPDTDSVCSAIGYAELADYLGSGEYVPLAWGGVNKETLLVLSRFGVKVPEDPKRLVGDCEVVLVDTHHPGHLPESLDTKCVVEIIDHHPAGEPSAFPNAKIQNEEVGAAATLVVERFRELDVRPTAPVAGLLPAAIIDRKSTRLNSSHTSISYSPFFFKKKTPTH